MFNKKIASEIAVGIMMLLAIVVGGIFWLQGRQQLASNQPAVIDKQESKTQETEEKKVVAAPDLEVPAGWKLYKHDVLGIEFIYPEAWGEPRTEPRSSITTLAGIADGVSDETNDYFDSIKISFTSKEKDPDYRTPEIRIFGEKYGGEYYPNLNAEKFGHTDTIAKLKASGSICDYVINFNTEYADTLDEFWNACDGNVKQDLIREKQPFGGELGTRYSYDLKQFSYKKLQNGLFDNLLASQLLGSVSQIKDDSLDMTAFIEQAKTGYLWNKAITESKLAQHKRDFAQFAASIHSFKSLEYSQGEFKIVAGEDSNVTTIRKYYWLVSAGRLQEAYAMYADQDNITFDKFKGWYENVFFAKPADFKKTGDNQYEFLVQYQERNTDPTRYRVVMKVVGDKLKTESSVEILTEEASFGEYKAYALRRGNQNFVVLAKNGKEEIIDQGAAEYDKDYKNMGAVKFFSDIQFSSKGNYVTYNMFGYEWSQGYVYDIKTKKTVFTQNSPGTYAFSGDEKYFVSCASSAFDGTYNGLIFKSDNFKESVFDVLSYEKGVMDDYRDIECRIEKDSVMIDLNNDNWEGEGKDQKPANKTLIYSLSQNKVIK